MRAAVYDRFWHSQGGGERHCAMVGVVLARSGVEVDLLTHQEPGRVARDEALRARLAAAASECAHRFDEDAFAERWREIAARHDLR